MTQLKNLITENTPISISLLISLAGGIFWLTTLYSKTEANAEALKRIEYNQEKYTENLEQINERLSRIEGYLKQWEQ